MHPTKNNTEGLEEVRELNRLFLSFLRRNPPAAAERFGLPRVAAAALPAASDETLDALAEFPQAMFRLELESLASRAVKDPGRAAPDAGHQALQLTLLVSAWNLSRHSEYAARLFLGLSDRDLAILRAAALADLPRVSLASDMVRCAFTENPSLWPKLLAEPTAQSRRELVLLGLQPRHAPPGLAA